jgi:hypothetical protein
VTQSEPTVSRPRSEAELHRDETEEYGGGAIESRHGYIPIWLLVVYGVLALWGLYYAHTYWGGLGPGRIYETTEGKEVID